MEDNFLYTDIETRAYHTYGIHKDLAKKFREKQWYDSSLRFELKDSKEINGKSWSTGDDDYIEINKGVIDIFHRYFREVMEYQKDRFLMSILPDMDEEKVRKLSVEGLLRQGEKIQVWDSKVISADKANLCSIYVSRFILQHEMGHIFYGHCKYIRRYGGDLEYLPMYYNNNQDSKVPLLDIRAMEVMADIFATMQSFEHVVEIYSDFKNQVWIQGVQPNELFFWWSFAIRSHFLLCLDCYNDHSYSPSMKHLPSNARWNLVLEIISGTIKSDMYNNVFKKESIYQELLQGAIYAEEVYNEIKFTSYDWIKEIESDTKYYEYMDEVRANWEQLQSKLEEYSRIAIY